MVVVRGVVEGGVLDELREIELDALVLRDGHLPLLEFCSLLILDEFAELQFGRQLLLVREARGIDRREARDVVAAAREGVVDGARRMVVEFGVISLVIEESRVLGIVLELVLPDLIEQTRQVACRSGGRICILRLGWRTTGRT